MHARFTKFVFVLLISCFLSSCGRDNELVIPIQQAPQVTPACLDGSPYKTPKIVDSISFSDVGYNFNYESFDYSLDVRHLINSSTVVIDPVNQFFLPNILSELIDTESDGLTLTSSQADRLSNGGFTHTGTYAAVIFNNNDETVEEELDLKNGVDSLRIPLDKLNNEVNVKFIVSLQAPFSGIECSLDEPFRELISRYDSGEINDSTTAAVEELAGMEKSLAIEVNYNFFISRDAVSEISNVDLGDITLYSNNSLEGNNVAISENYLIVGVPLEDSLSRGIFTAAERERDVDGSIVNDLGENSGAVYIYEKDSLDNWKFSWMLKASNADSGDRFGHSVSLNGRWLAVSAPGEDSSASGQLISYSNSGVYDQTLAQSMMDAGTDNLSQDSGAVYLYHLDNTGNWQQFSYIKHFENFKSANGVNKLFGDKVVVKSVTDSTGSYSQHTLAISDPLEDTVSDPASESEATVDSGTVFTYRYNELLPNQLLYTGALKAPHPKSEDRFGYDLDIFDDGRLAISAPFENSADNGIVTISSSVIQTYLPEYTSSNAGAVFIYNPNRQDSPPYNLRSVIKASNADENDLFGSVIEVSGDFLAISAPKEDSDSVGFNRQMVSNAANDTGAVYVYSYNSSEDQFMQELYVKPPVNEDVSGFGNALAINKNNMVISHSKRDSNDVEDSGSIYVYSKSFETNLWEVAFESNVIEADEYGASVAIEGETVVAVSLSEEKPLTLLR